MLLRPSPCLSLLAALLALAACGSDEAYPSLVPLSELTAPPAIPAHAAEAAADPEEVGAALQARRAEAVSRAGAAQGGSVTDAAALQARAAALKDRAGQLAGAEPSGGASLTIAPAGSAPPPSAAPAADPETAARAEALRERARRMLDGEPAPSPCPPGATTCPQP